MSIVVALFMALLFLPMHACNARHTFGFLSYNKDVEKDKLEEIVMEAFPTFEGTKETILGSKIILSMDLDETQAAAEVHGLKKNARSMLESGSKEEVKNPAAAHANEDENEAVEDVGVMDYVQAHRKSPIHNHH